MEYTPACTTLVAVRDRWSRGTSSESITHFSKGDAMFCHALPFPVVGPLSQNPWRKSPTSLLRFIRSQSSLAHKDVCSSIACLQAFLTVFRGSSDKCPSPSSRGSRRYGVDQFASREADCHQCGIYWAVDLYIKLVGRRDPHDRDTL